MGHAPSANKERCMRYSAVFTFFENTMKTCTVWKLSDSLKHVIQEYEDVGEAAAEMLVLKQDCIACIAAFQGAE